MLSTDAFLSKTIKISLITIPLFLLVLITSSVFNAHAQQLEAGGAATAGGVTITGGICNQCIIINAPQATGGAAIGGAATGPGATSRPATDLSTSVDKGNALLNQGKYAEAIQYCDKALAIDSNNKYVLYNKGNALLNQGKYAEAIQYYEQSFSYRSK